MRKAFLEFLANEGLISQERVEDIHQMLRASREPIGAIAFSYGMIGDEAIDDILDAQRADRRPFGEIAIEKGLLTQDQVHTLLCVQKIRAATEVAEVLVLSGVCAMDEVVPRLGHFLFSIQGKTLEVS